MPTWGLRRDGRRYCSRHRWRCCRRCALAVRSTPTPLRTLENCFVLWSFVCFHLYVFLSPPWLMLRFSLPLSHILTLALALCVGCCQCLLIIELFMWLVLASECWLVWLVLHFLYSFDVKAKKQSFLSIVILFCPSTKKTMRSFILVF